MFGSESYAQRLSNCTKGPAIFQAVLNQPPTSTNSLSAKGSERISTFKRECRCTCKPAEHQCRLEAVASAADAAGRNPYRDAVDTAVANGNRIIFTGHSLGGAVAILATLWLLSSKQRPSSVACITFGAPLVGDGQLGELVRRNDWARLIHQVVWRHDLVPRGLLSPGQGVQSGLTALLDATKGRLASTGLAEGPVQLTPQQEAEIKQMITEVRDVPVPPAAPVPAKGRGGILRAITGAVLGPPRWLLGVGKGLTQDGYYRPFGVYLLHTSSGSIVCEEPSEVLQMLTLTLQSLSKGIDTRAWYVVAEHLIPRYDAAVAAFTVPPGTGEVKFQAYSAFLQDAGSMFELGVLRAFNDQYAGLQDIKALLRTKLDPRTLDREKEWLEAQKSMDVINAFKKQYGANYAEEFRRDTVPECKDVEQARRVLRLFWDTTIQLYASEQLPQSFFARGSPWLIRGAKNYRNMVEPIEIANFYRLELWKQWSVGRRHYIESNNRPLRFTFLETQFAHEYPEEKLQSTLEYAQRLADEIDHPEVVKQLDNAVH
ncbi:hypothetical protein WJX72_008897 [[Myrmecia] bisecta]|uniref:Fungal lipase-like domain-containing protein n=1 Tax=[Myrmecia] bisecta TaxID=41462 RepID=A0AAW1QRW6_9CHLO